MDFSITFLKTLCWGIYLIGPIFLLLGFIIVSLGLIVGRIESWTKFDALYWALITALTVGYGDIKPIHKLARVLSTFIALVGIMFSGIVVAITIEATGNAFEQHVQPELNQHFTKEKNKD